MEATREFPFTHADFAFIAETVNRSAGIVLGPHKRNLVYGRLVRRLRVLGLASFRQYCELLKGPSGPAETGQMINAITTNLTAFFREPHHFTHLQGALDRQIARRPAKRRLRLWSAGCSTGEEAYSMAMVLQHALDQADAAGWDARILATDIDTAVLAKGETGCYPAERVASVPATYRARYLTGAPSGSVAVDPAVQSLVAFKPLNLLEEWPMKGPFDAIFCRNVVIYFDKPTQRRLFQRFADLLVLDGWLYIGHSESLFRICDRFAPQGRTIYRKVA